MEIIDLDDCKLSIKNGTYSGAAGSKDGILYRGEEWMVKYPKNIKGLERTGEASYSTAPLSEFIGSHVFEILGYDVHETLLGKRHGKIVVACKDFTGQDKRLLEIRSIKNYANEDLADRLDRSMSSTGSEHYVDLEELLLHLKYNDILTKIPGIEDRFWEQAVIDIFINNNDRNNGNWGILRDYQGDDTLAPIFDNGACLQTKISEDKIKEQISDEKISLTRQNAINTQTAYAINDHELSSQKFLMLAKEYPALERSIKKVVPLIEDKMPQICDFIYSIPETYIDIEGRIYNVCSKERKELYVIQMQARQDLLLMPVYQEITNKTPQKQQREFDDHQLSQIELGRKNGLTQDQIDLYADYDLTWKQMYQIRYGLNKGLTKEAVSVYANKRFTEGQMYQIRTGFENGLTIEQIMTYADPELSFEQMQNIREDLEDAELGYDDGFDPADDD